MSFTFQRAVRENVTLLVGLAATTGAGKTLSAMLLAKGICGDEPFAVIDTEARRALHYADMFKFDHADLKPPFSSDAYGEAIKYADSKGYKVIVVDSMSHEHDGEGGMLDYQESELNERVRRAMQRNQDQEEWKLREAMGQAAWIKPKMAHKRMVQQLLQCRAHLILCFRADDKIEFKKGADGRSRAVPKETLSGFKGWIPICDKRLPFELTASFILTPDAPGIPKPIKLQEQHKAFFPLDKPLSEASGRAIAAWAAGGKKIGGEGNPASGDSKPQGRPSSPPAPELTDETASQKFARRFSELLPEQYRVHANQLLREWLTLNCPDSGGELAAMSNAQIEAAWKSAAKYAQSYKAA